MIISRKRFEAEVQKRVEEAVCKTHENMYRDERERDMHRNIDHPSHHYGDNVKAAY